MAHPPYYPTVLHRRARDLSKATGKAMYTLSGGNINFATLLKREKRRKVYSIYRLRSFAVFNLTASGGEKVASWFESARKAQDELISSYSEKELEIISD